MGKRSGLAGRAPPRLLALTLAVISWAPFAPLWASGEADGPAPLAADVQVLFEDFEGAFPGGAWNVTDTNAGNGSDMWGPSGYRTFASNGSAWSAGQGTQTLFWAGDGTPEGSPFADGLENASLYALWNATDLDAANGDDTWNVSTTRSHNGTKSLWCAAVGDHSVFADTNANLRLYDNLQDAIVWREVDLSGLAAVNASSATLEFWYFLASEQSVDFLNAVYFDGSQWVALTTASGDSGGWQAANASVPAAATRVGFRFTSDVGGVLEGAYVDDIVLRAQHDEPNRALHTYDVDQNATMWRAVNVSAFASADLSFEYWLETDSGNDTLSAGYFAGGAWTYLNNLSGSSAGWQRATVAIPPNATRVAFRFATDGAGHAEGAYLDNIAVVGHVLDILCSASVSATTGYEALTAFDYSATATQGLAPYGWSWNFSDGGRVTAQNATRTFGSVGTYTANLTVADSAGQSCTAAAPAVTVVHDTTAVSMSPASANVVEGKSVVFSGFDRRGHPVALDWTADPAACGALSAPQGVQVTFTVADGAGGSVCTMTGSFGAANATANVTITHNLTLIVLDPPQASVVEGGSVNFSATDANGHALDFLWSVPPACGNLSTRVGPATTLNATGEAGTDCRVAATLGGSVGVANVTLLHDTSVIALTAGSGLMIEGATRDITALDRFAHPVDAAWSLEPAACGELSRSFGNTTSFRASPDGGGTTCTVIALVAGAAPVEAAFTILHDLSTITLQANATVVEEGATVAFLLADAFGHPYAASWSVLPTLCGAFEAQLGGNTTFSAALLAGGANCTVSATVGSSAWRANLSIVHGPGVSLTIDPAAPSVVEGASLTFSFAVKDAAGHSLAGLEADWSSPCAALSITPAVSTTAAFSAEAGGTSCTVTAAVGGLIAAATVNLAHEGPFSVSVEPASATLGGGATRTFTASVSDARGHRITNASLRWTTTCGALSATSGYAVDFTAPGDLGGAECRVTAALVGNGSQGSSSSAVTTPMSLLVPLAGLMPAVVAAVLLLRWRKKRPKRPKRAKRAATAPQSAEAKPSFEVEIR